MVMATATDRRAGLSRLGPLAVLIGLGALGEHVGAQALRVQPEFESTVTVTNNASFTSRDQAQSDTIISVNPRLHVTSRGGRAAIEGTFGLEAVTYLNNAQDSIVRPRGSLSLRSQLVERLMYLDASVTADRISADPFAARPESATAFNDYTQMRYRFTPYVERELTPSLSLLARTDHIITRRVGSATGAASTEVARDSHEQEQTLRLAQRPQPFGWTAELTRQETRLRYSDQAILTQTAARAIGTYAVGPQLIVGVSVGRENNEYSLIDRSDSIVGVRFNWQPNERGEVNASLEKRFFGTGGDLEWRQRSPFLGFSIRANRMPVAQSGSHLFGAAGDNLVSLLDGVLTTRYPDPGQRSTAVNDLVRQLNLPGTLTGPVELYTSYAQLQDNVSATALFFGRLTTASATVFGRRRTRLADVEDVLAPASLSSDNLQYGVEIDVSRRLSPVLTADGGVRYTRIEGLGIRDGQASRDAAIRFGMTRIVSINTRVSAGLRYQTVSSSVTSPANEMAVVGALLHRF